MVLFSDQRPVLTEGLTEQIANWAYNLQYDDLPADVIDAARRGLVDYVPQALGGATGRGIGESGLGGALPTIDLSVDHSGDCTVIGRIEPAIPQYAALANGTSGCALDLDDTHRWSVPTHLGSTLYGAAIAMAEREQVDFATLTAATVAGHEIVAKLGMALRPGVGAVDVIQANSLGAAVQTAKILGMTESQFVDALGLACFFTSGCFEFIGSGYWARRTIYGWHAHNGIVAAFLVQKGHRGPQRAIEAPYGFLNAFSVAPDDTVLAELGNPFEITRNGIKIYPTTRYIHAELDALLALVRENGIKPENVERVLIEKPRAMHEVTGVEARRAPKIPEESRVSSYYWSAVALTTGDVWLDGYSPQLFESTEIRDLIERITCRHDPELDQLFPDKYTTRVIVSASDGTRYERTVDYPRGEPEAPLSWAELLDKGRRIRNSCFADFIDESEYENILQWGKNCSPSDGVAEYAKLLRRQLI